MRRERREPAATFSLAVDRIAVTVDASRDQAGDVVATVAKGARR